METEALRKVNKGRKRKATAHRKGSRMSCFDRVGILPMAQFMTELSKLPALRKEKVLKVKELIEKGEYETEEKLDIAIKNILKELGG